MFNDNLAFIPTSMNVFSLLSFLMLCKQSVLFALSKESWIDF